eukprot:m.162444 g.162444  ORF g.162444 m.162444 type:complete len:240 (-) comp14374_c0_seq23:1796-2515(-)
MADSWDSSTALDALGDTGVNDHGTSGQGIRRRKADGGHIPLDGAALHQPVDSVGVEDTFGPLDGDLGDGGTVAQGGLEDGTDGGGEFDRPYSSVDDEVMLLPSTDEAQMSSEEVLAQQRIQHPEWFYDVEMDWRKPWCAPVHYFRVFRAFYRRIVGIFSSQFVWLLFLAQCGVKGALYSFLQSGILPFFQSYVKVGDTQSVPIFVEVKIMVLMLLMRYALLCMVQTLHNVAELAAVSTT